MLPLSGLMRRGSLAVAAGNGYTDILGDEDARLAPFVTFTRSSTATYYGSGGLLKTAAVNEPRYEYDPVTLALRGLLVEEQRTNLLLRSQEFDEASWTKYQSSISPNSEVAPDGTLTADKVVDTVANDSHQVSVAPSLAENTIYSASVYVKAAQISILRIAITTKAGTTGQTYFDLSAGVVAVLGSDHTAAIWSVGGDWYRCIVTFNSGAGASSTTTRFGLAKNSGSSAYTGDGVGGLYLWGAQVEAGGFATSYIPTTISAVTRAADAPGVSSLASVGYNPTQGTFFAEYFTPPGQGATFTPTVFSLNDATTGNRVQARYESGGALSGGLVIAGGISQAALGPLGALVPLSRVKLATAISSNDFAAVAGGSAPLTDSAGSLPSVTRLEIGTFLSSQHLNGWLRRLRYYPRRLPDAILQAITA